MHRAAFFYSGQGVKSLGWGGVTVKLGAFSGWGGAGQGSLEIFLARGNHFSGAGLGRGKAGRGGACNPDTGSKNQWRKPDLKTSCWIWNLSFDLNAISASATELSPRMSSLCCFVFEASI